MRRVFGDTFFFIALLNPRDMWHAVAVQFSRDYKGKIVTTRWVLAELGNALCSVSGRRGFVAFLHGLAQQEQFEVLQDSDALFEDGVRLFELRPDKEWSLTDCISFAAMRQNSIDEALTGDRHFEQAGFAVLLRQSS